MSQARHYQERAKQEIANYAQVETVHDLPDIFHYWSHRYLRPKLNVLGLTDLDDFYRSYIAKACQQAGSSVCRILSIGAGNCDTELKLAELLAERGVHNYRFYCLDLNPHMLDRGRQLLGLTVFGSVLLKIAYAVLVTCACLVSKGRGLRVSPSEGRTMQGWRVSSRAQT